MSISQINHIERKPSALKVSDVAFKSAGLCSKIVRAILIVPLLISRPKRLTNERIPLVTTSSSSYNAI